jgi:hypothetical protein
MAYYLTGKPERDNGVFIRWGTEDSPILWIPTNTRKPYKCETCDREYSAGIRMYRSSTGLNAEDRICSLCVGGALNKTVTKQGVKLG